MYVARNKESHITSNTITMKVVKESLPWSPALEKKHHVCRFENKIL